MKTMKTIKRKLPDASCSRGAPMGRRNNIPSDIETASKLYINPLRWVDGDYDQGGAYFGGGQGDFIFWAQGETATEQIDVFVRAFNREDAKEMVLEEIPNAKFYR